MLYDACCRSMRVSVVTAMDGEVYARCNVRLRQATPRVAFVLAPISAKICAACVPPALLSARESRPVETPLAKSRSDVAFPSLASRGRQAGPGVVSGSAADPGKLFSHLGESARANHLKRSIFRGGH